MRTKVRKGLPQWRCKENIERRYADACAKQHLPADLYQVGISQDGNRISMNFLNPLPDYQACQPIREKHHHNLQQ